MNIQLHLRDRNPGMTAAWEEYFTGIEGVTISQGDIFGATADAIVSPANSFGYMDGGIDLVYVQRFGWQLQERLQEVIRRDHDGELPVGQAVVIPTGDVEIPHLASAPTMRVPEDVSQTVNAYLAFRAALRAIREWNLSEEEKIRSVLCPGLGTAIGLIPHRVAAQQMLLAYLVVERGRRDYFDRAFKVLYNHEALVKGLAIRSE